MLAMRWLVLRGTPGVLSLGMTTLGWPASGQPLTPETLMLTGTVPLAQTISQNGAVNKKLCPQPALSRLVRHRILPGETLESIAQKYNLIPATLMGFNPVLRQGTAPVGSEIIIPPYNGILAKVAPGKSLKEVAATYGIRPDLLFEVNGCQTHPQTVFVPGVNWSPLGTIAGRTAPSLASNSRDRYPLPAIAAVLTPYGWQSNPTTGKVEFHPGVDLMAQVGTPVLAVADGVVAFAGERRGYGKLVVINHRQGWQTRYSQLATLSVSPGQPIQAGKTLGTVGPQAATRPSHLHFEMRQNSHLGWVAQDPTVYLNAAQAGLPQAVK